MPRTPDRRPGEADEEGIVFENRSAGQDPPLSGGVRFVDGHFRFKDANGVFDPRTTPGGSDSEVQFNSSGVLSGSSLLRFNSSTGALTASIFTGSFAQFYSLKSFELSGSLTTLADGTSYLIGGSNISVVSGSAGSVTISATGLAPIGSSFLTVGNDATLTNERSLSAGSGLKSLDGGAGSSYTLSIDDSVVATVSGATFSGPVKFSGGLSGSLTTLVNGSPYIVAGPNIVVSTGSNGSISITGSVGGSSTQVQFNDGGSLGGSSLFTFNKTSGVVSSSVFSADTYLETDGYIRFNQLGVPVPSLPTDAAYIFMSGSNNDLTFSHYDRSSATVNSVRLNWIENALTTGILHGGLLSTENGTTTFSITSGSGLVVNYNASLGSDPDPIVTYVTWPTYVSQSLPSTGSAQITYIAVNYDGTLLQQVTPFGTTSDNNYIPIGRVLHQSGSVTNGTITTPRTSYGLTHWHDDFTRLWGPLKVSGHVLAASGSNLTIKKTGGTSYAIGRNYQVNPNDPNQVIDPPVNVSKVYREYTSGSNGTYVLDTGVANAGYTEIDPTRYNNGGTLTSVGGSTDWTIQRVFWFPNSVNNAFFVYYGENVYATQTDALNAISTETFTEGNNTIGAAIFVAYIVVQRTCTNLSDTTKARIVQASISRGTSTGGAGGGGGGTTSPGGASTYVQFNDGGTFGGDSGLTYDKTTDTLTIGNVSVGDTGLLSTTGLTATVFNTNATTVNFAGAATSINIGTALGTNIISGTIKAPQGLSGSLTKLTDGTSYIIGGGNMTVTTGSSGAITLATINSGTIHGVTAGTGLKGGGTSGTVTLSIDDSVVATVSGATFQGAVKFNAGLSGSLTGSGLQNGSVLFSGPTGGITQSNSTFFWDSANSRLGIGTNSPGDTLSVNGTAAVTGSIQPGTSLTYDLGSTSKRWRDVYARTGSFSGDLVISGDLTVLGTSSIINSEVVNIKDNAILLNAGPSPLSFGGVYVADTSANTTGSIIWDVTADRWKAGFVGSEINLVTTGSTDNLNNKTIPISGVASSTISGGTQGGVAYYNTSGFLSSSSPGTSGQILQSGGTGAPTWSNFGTLLSGSNVITGSGTTNYLSKFTSGRALTDSIVYDDGTNVGVGTATPGYRLDVVGSGLNRIRVYSTDSQANLTIQGTTFGQLENITGDFFVTNGSASGAMILRTNTTERLRINSTGNVGIGTNSYTSRLFVSGSSTSTTPTLVVREGTNSTGGAGAFDVQGYTGTSLLFVSGSGNVGIGVTTNSTYELQVATTSTSKNVLGITNGTLALSLGLVNTNGSFLYERSNNPLRFGTNDSERVRIDASGNVGIGTTAMDAKFVVNGNSVFSGSVNPDSDATRDLGSSTKRWNNVYAANISGSLTGSGLLSGQVVVAGTGGLISGSNNFWWDNTNARVGIGISSGLGAKLQVSGTGSDVANIGGFTAGDAYVYVGNLSTYGVVGAYRGDRGASLPLVLQSAGGDVGIGTTSFTGRLFVSGSSTGTTTTLLVKHGIANGSNLPVLDVQNSAGTSILFVSGSGNVGIGTASPAKKLHIVNNQPLRMGLAAEYWDFLQNNTNEWAFLSNTSTYSIFMNNATGNVGIGTNTTADKFSVNGSMSVTGSLLPGTDNLYNLGSSTKRWNTIYAANISGSLTGSGLAAGSVVFATTGGLLSGSNSQFFWNTSTNRLGIGNSSPAYALDVSSDISVYGIRFGRGNGNTAGNVVVGSNNALNAVTSGTDLTAVGDAALAVNTTGADNTAVGYGSLFVNTTGASNTAVGSLALFSNTVNSDSTAVGSLALGSSTGQRNTALGSGAGGSVAAGANNLMLGYNAGSSVTTGNNNTIIGSVAGTAALSDTIILGAASSERMRIDSSGNMGLATTTPTARLHVSGSTTSATPTTLIKAGVPSPTGAVLDVQTNGGTSLFFVSGSGEIGLSQTISSVQTATVTTTSTSLATLMTVSSTIFRSAEFVVQGSDTTSGKYVTAKLLAIHNGTVTTYNEYGSVNAGGFPGTFSVTNPSAGSFLLQVTPASTNSTVWKVTAILTKV